MHLQDVQSWFCKRLFEIRLQMLQKSKPFHDYGWHRRLLLYRQVKRTEREDYVSIMHNKPVPVMSDDLILEVCIGKYHQ